MHIVVGDLQLIDMRPLGNDINVLTMVRVSTRVSFPVARDDTILRARFHFLFNQARTRRWIVQVTFVIPTVFHVAIIRVTVTSCYQLRIYAYVVAVSYPRDGYLLFCLERVARSVFVIFAIDFHVRPRVVGSTRSWCHRFVLLIGPNFRFRLYVNGN